MDRRDFLRISGWGLVAGMPVPWQPAVATGRSAPPSCGQPDYTLRIGRSLVELAPDHVVSTLTYNGQFPGPLLRLKEGRPVVVDVYNDTDQVEQLHWHGLAVPAAVDGAIEEGTPVIPARGRRRIAFTPGPAGFRFYHTHVRAGNDLTRGQYSGLLGPIYIEPRLDPGAYDREVFLTLKEFDPVFSQGGDMAVNFLRPRERDTQLQAVGEAAMKASLARGMPHGYEVGYQAFAVNGRKLGHGDPVRVKAGERVLFHILNGSATELRSLALPGHTFRVIALDGNRVPRPAEVPVLWLGAAERISAIVEMKQPGVWVLGDLADDDRGNGMGIVIEYAGQHGRPQWLAPPSSDWDYRWFASDASPSVRRMPDEMIEMTFAKQNAADQGFNRWTINGEAFDMAAMKPLFHLREGRRYRLRMHNQSDDIHPIHLHRHRFEITRIAGQPTDGVVKDVAMLGGYQSMDVDFTADQRGLSLFHCHMQLHMDFGFMALFECA
ncbi:MAG TPA: multicopper oxidase domain-containing protein [Dyella sp.]|uniref:multicopper oxidase family protein n=1 Tax=Dyella sp. TaxID=1869338 RepID=UPI002BF4E083|nr:multicopper oxidase domain-containing protein [Dyella sp.]HTV85556.1 multicopper oxidase domain-containing protein [Dyella sp.]